MNENQNFFESAVPNMPAFREIVRKLKRDEEEKFAHGEPSSAHFQGVDPEELLEEDALIYKKYLDDTLTKEEFAEYRRQFINVRGMKNSRHNFAAYIGNKLTPRFLKTEAEEFIKGGKTKNSQK